MATPSLRRFLPSTPLAETLTTILIYASNVNEGEAPITENFAKYGIYAGQVIVADETKPTTSAIS